MSRNWNKTLAGEGGIYSFQRIRVFHCCRLSLSTFLLQSVRNAKQKLSKKKEIRKNKRQEKLNKFPRIEGNANNPNPPPPCGACKLRIIFFAVYPLSCDCPCNVRTWTPLPVVRGAGWDCGQGIGGWSVRQEAHTMPLKRWIMAILTPTLSGTVTLWENTRGKTRENKEQGVKLRVGEPKTHSQKCRKRNTQDGS